jgi:hypothetical protein
MVSHLLGFRSVYICFFLLLSFGEKKREREGEGFIARLITYDPIYPVFLLNLVNVSSQKFLHS